MKKGDEIIISILGDGTIKSETDAISPANHQSAEQFLREVNRLAGGKVERKHKPGHTHTHTHHGVTYEHTH